MNLKLVIPFLMIVIIIVAGCETVSDRFLEEVDERIISNDNLQHPASPSQKVTFQDDIVLERNGEVTIEVGFFNTLGAASVTVASDQIETSFGIVETSNIIECEDKKGYDYTLELDSPIANVSAYEGVGLMVTIKDKAGIGADELTCPVSVVDVRSGNVIDTQELTIGFTGELA